MAFSDLLKVISAGLSWKFMEVFFHIFKNNIFNNNNPNPFFVLLRNKNK